MVAQSEAIPEETSVNIMKDIANDLCMGKLCEFSLYNARDKALAEKGLAMCKKRPAAKSIEETGANMEEGEEEGPGQDVKEEEGPGQDVIKKSQADTTIMEQVPAKKSKKAQAKMQTPKRAAKKQNPAGMALKMAEVEDSIFD